MHDSSHHDPASPELAACATAAHEALRRLMHLAAGELANAPGTEPAGSLSLEWSSTMSADDLLDQVIHGVRLLHPMEGGVVAGRVYCYRCGEARCEHGAPTAPGQVFAGYANSGEPVWQELFNELNAMGDDRVDRLFEKPPMVLTRLVSWRHLVEQQLASGGRHSTLYRILGQVILGYVSLAGIRCAMTVQIVETADRRLWLQTIAPDALREALADSPPNRRSLLFRLADALAKLRRAVDGWRGPWEAARCREDRGKVAAEMSTQLRHFANSIEQKGRQAARRTDHAEQRQREQRPVHKASDDVAAAKPGDFYEDTVRHSKIVVGRGGRCHVFYDDGQHVTTIQLGGDRLERRLRGKRYVPLTPDQIRTFQPIVLERFKAGGQETAGHGKPAGAG